MEDLVRRLATQTLSLFTIFPPLGAKSVRHEREHEGYTVGMGGVETLFFRGDGRVWERPSTRSSCSPRPSPPRRCGRRSIRSPRARAG